MRAAAARAWPAMCRQYEGVTSWMYLDTKGKVTTGVGFLIDSVKAAQALPWHVKSGRRATPDEVATEWRRVKALQGWKSYNGLSARWRDSARLWIGDETIDGLLRDKTEAFWDRLGQALPRLEQAPADAQLALMDESWQNGPAFLDAGTDWTNTRAGALAQDWARCADAVPDPRPDPGDNDQGDRAERRQRLFRNAARVARLGLDRDVLWDARTPVDDEPTAADVGPLSDHVAAAVAAAFARQLPPIGEALAQIRTELSR